VTGAGGLLGREVVEQLRRRGHEVVACDRRALDITDTAASSAVVRAAAPEAIVHCAAFTNVDTAETAQDAARTVNEDGTANVARAAAEVGARFVYVSTDYVFDGAARAPYRPDDPVNPVNAYGRTKLAGERAALLAGDALIARTSWVYGRSGTNFGSRLLARARSGESVRAITDQSSVPTWVCDTASVIITLLERAAPAGTYHVNNSGAASWYEFAREALARAGVGAAVEGVTLAELALPAPRPAWSALDVAATEAVVGTVRPWSDALAAAIADGL
jgi:dTDP-4-dehydrorhamnose reductase